MTVDVDTPQENYTVAGIGPYAIPWPYEAGTIRVQVSLGGVYTDISPTDFSVSPASGPAGNVYLTPAAVTLYNGQSMLVQRETTAEQGWEASFGGRETGLERQLDKIVMAQQEMRRDIAQSLRGTGANQPQLALEPGQTTIWDGVKFVPGPKADEIADAQLQAQLAASAAAAAGIYAPAYFNDYADFWADETAWPTNTIINTRNGFQYIAAAPVSIDHHLTRPDGRKFYVIAGGNGYDVRAFGAVGDGVADDTAALQAAFNAGDVAMAAGDTYAFTALTVPDGRIVAQNGATLRKTGSEAIQWLIVGNGVTWDDLLLSIPGAGSAANQIQIGTGFVANSIVVRPDAATGLSTLMTIRNEGMSIKRIDIEDVARPITISNEGSALGFGGRIGRLRLRNYIRALSARYADGWSIGQLDAAVRHPAAAKSPGHNGLLIEGASDWGIEEARIFNSGEHAFRIGGSVAGGQTHRWRIGALWVRDPGGCTFKSNATEGGEKAVAGEIGYLRLESTATAAPGGNSEFIRLAHVEDLHIGVAEAYTIGSGTISCQHGLLMNDVQGLTIDVLRVKNPQAGMVSVDESTDAEPGPVSNIVIGRLEGDPGAGSNAIGFSMPTQTLGNFTIADGSVADLNTNLVRFSNVAGGLTGRVHIGCDVFGAVEPIIQDAPNTDRVTADIRYGGRRFVGDGVAMAGSMVSFAHLGVAGRAFDPANVTAKGALMLSATAAASGSGSFGPGVAFGRPGSTRRGAGIAAKQTSANAYDVGLAIFAGAGTAATDAVTERWNLLPNGDMDFLASQRGPVVRSPNGARWRLEVTNGGVLSVVAL